MNEYKIERIGSESFSDLSIIFRSAFEKEMPVKMMQQKFSTSAFGTSFIGYIAYSTGGEPAAYYGVFPCMVYYNGNKFLAAQSGDTMTHKNHQGKGLFTMLAKKTYELAKAEGIHFVFGFPNENSFPGFVRKLQWEHFDDMSSYEIRVKTVPWIRLKNTLKVPQKWHNNWCRFIFSFYKNGHSFESSSKTNETPVVDHSHEFFQYKSYNANYLKTISGKNIWFKHDEMFLVIGDMEFIDEASFLKTLKSLKGLAFLCGLPHLRFYTSSNTIGEKLFARYGNKMQNTYPVGGINLTGIFPMEKLKFTAADNDTF